MAKTTKLIGYGISFDMKLVGGVKTADDFARASKSVQKSINKSTDATKQHKLQLEVLDQSLKKNIVTQKQHDEARFSVEAKEIKRQRRLEKERRLVLGLDQQESLLAKNRQQRARMAGMAASGVSGLGMGGRAAGAARFLGGTAGLGLGAAGIGLGFGAASVVKESLRAFADLETQVTALKSLFGEGLGNQLQVEFRNLAKTTILTNSQLIENAKTWASYGLTTEGLTDRLKRLGTVAGGNSEKFRALTIAFAQVNAQGKLMGQEKNQLINAGMSLQAVADAAGISMDDFADAMKNGEIKATHLNEALVSMTSKGGLFGDFLEKQAETINGKLTVLRASWEEFLQALGNTEKGPAGKFIDKLIAASKFAKQAADAWSRATGFFSPGVPDPVTGIQGFEQAGFPTGSEALKELGGGAGVDLPTLFTRGGKAIDLSDPQYSDLRSQLVRTPQGMSPSDPMYTIMKKNKEADAKRMAAQAKVDDALEQEAKERLRRRREIEQTILDDLSSNWDLTQQQFANALSNITKDSPVFEKAMELFVSRIFTEGGEGFVGPMPATRAIEEGAARNKQQLLDAAQFEIDVAEQEIENANQRHKLEMELLKIKEKEVAQALAMDKKIAAGPQQKDAMFTGGSVEEFMFLRRQTQINETAKAVKEAENSAAEQRKQIEADRKAADAIRDGKIDALTTAIDQLYQEISNLND